MSETCDILVVGAGAAGMAAAVGAARSGCRTLLLDQREAAGGTGGFSGLTTLCGLFDSDGQWLNHGFAREFAEHVAETPPWRMGKVWVLPFRPEKYRAVAAELVANTPNLRARWNCAVTEVAANDGQISSVNGIPAGAVIDCSGRAEVARLLNLPCLETDETTQSSAVVFTLDHVEAELNSAAALARALLPLARAGHPGLSLMRGPEPHTATAKFAGTPEQVPGVVEILRREAEGFERCEARPSRLEISRRAGRMIMGEYLLTEADVLGGRKFANAAARAAWPIEQWDEHGRMSVRHLPPRCVYEIPGRSLRAAAIQNLFMAGKTISADVDAMASARVMGTCLATGTAAGQLAAAWLAAEVTA